MSKNRNAGKTKKFKEKNKNTKRSPREEVIGRVSMTREGYGFIIRDGFDDDIFVSARKMRGALNGDTVKVALTAKKTKTRNMEGEIIEIIERSKKPFIEFFKLQAHKPG